MQTMGSTIGLTRADFKNTAVTGEVASADEDKFFFSFFYYEWEHRTGTMCPFSSLHPLRKGKEV